MLILSSRIMCVIFASYALSHMLVINNGLHLICEKYQWWWKGKFATRTPGNFRAMIMKTKRQSQELCSVHIQFRTKKRLLQ